MKRKLLAILLVAMLVVSCLSLISCKSDNIKEKVNGYFTLTKQDGQDFKILQLTDIHMASDTKTIKINNEKFYVNDVILNSIDKLVKATNPDLIVLTGDMAYPLAFQSGSDDNLAMLKRLLTHIETYKIPYAPIFGNHDEENTSLYTKADLCDYLESDELKYCLFERGYCDDKNSMGNYVINVVNKKGQLVQSLFLIDSNSYVSQNTVGAGDYDYIHEGQIKWYEEEVANLKTLTQLDGVTTPSSLAFFHIPLQEYLQAWNANEAGSNDATSNWEDSYSKLGETPCSSPVNSGFFNKALELGSTKGMYCGHDHINHFSIKYKGIDLTYGLSMDYYVYMSITNQTEQRGGTLTSIKDDGSHKIDPIRLSELD